MSKDLTNSRLDRQNILNNSVALESVRDELPFSGIEWQATIYVTREMVASYFQVESRTIGRYIEQNAEELQQNGYQVLRGKKIKEFCDAAERAGKNLKLSSKTRSLGIFDFRAFLDIAMLLSESERARALRQLMLDIVIDLINRKTGGGTKYINQRDVDFLPASLQEDNYRRKFTDALKEYVAPDRFKYAHFTDMIYISIFREKAKEYKKILDLKATDNARETFYSEILNIIAAYESGLAEELKQEHERLGHLLSKAEAEDLFHRFEKMALWKPLIHQGRTKMASRDMALREAFHYQLSEYIKPLDKDEYQKFLGAAGDELERLMVENQEVLKRLKERG